jgi:hypothetical protein
VGQNYGSEAPDSESTRHNITYLVVMRALAADSERVSII